MVNPNANVINMEDMHIPNKLTIVANQKPVIYGKPNEDWEDGLFGRVHLWSVPQLENEQALLMGREWIQEITTGAISARTAIKGLKLALSVKSTNPWNRRHLISQQLRGELATDNTLAREVLPDLDSFSAAPYTLRNQQQIGNVNIDANLMAQAAAGQDSNDQERESACFAALFLMRLLVKSPMNAVNALKNMRALYESFYGPARTISRFTITLARAVAYKNAITSLDRIALTFSHSLAFTHQYIIHDMTPQEVGVLTYLGFHPFAYSGLHSYTLMVKLHNLTKVRLDKLLALFYCDVTAPALVKMAALVNNYEMTEQHPNRSVLFRYCSLWGPQYFSELRSKNCSYLLYTLASAWKALNQQNENADPENIAALARLSPAIKDILKRAGNIIGDNLKRQMLENQNQQLVAPARLSMRSINYDEI